MMYTIIERLTSSDKERFWSKVNISDPKVCWEWKAAVNECGYGRFSVGTRLTRVHLKAHRVSLALFLGSDISPEMFVLHSCDNPACCNPNHLSQGTHKDNMLDMIRKGRSVISYGNAKLSWDKIDEIRNSSESRVKLVEKFSISKTTLSMILSNKTWRNEQRSIARIT